MISIVDVLLIFKGCTYIQVLYVSYAAGKSETSNTLKKLCFAYTN